MIGQYVEFQTGICSWEQGRVIDYDENSGILTIETDDGEKFRGCETQITEVILPE